MHRLSAAALTFLAAASATKAQSSEPLAKEYLEHMTAYADCQMYDKILSILKTDFKDMATRKEDGKELLQTPVTGAQFCIVYRKSDYEPQPSMACAWSKFGEGAQPWAAALYERRLKTTQICRSTQILVVPALDDRLSTLKETHFSDAANSESWAIGLMQTGQTWYVMTIAKREAEE
jgi:hypothetical protein